MKRAALTLLSLALALAACAPSANRNPDNAAAMSIESNRPLKEGLEVATLGAGCFWCVEAVFQRLEGVEKVAPGYTGGQVDNPTYKAVCSGQTGHAEVAQIHFDPEVISYEDLLNVFFYTHDPTTLNRQGNDVGTQYRSAIFYHDEQQKASAEKVLKEIEEKGIYDDPIVTEITALDKFYVAEDYHHNYYNENGNQPYCRIVIAPKVAKFKKHFEEKLKQKAESR